MAHAEILKRFDELSVWKQGDQRAPHKPLLVLYALGLWRRGLAEVSFREAEPELTALLREFGPPRRSDHPEQPFWRLQRDGVWAVHAPDDMSLKTGDTIPRVEALRSPEVRAGFTPDVLAAMKADPSLAPAIARRLLEQHFPKSLHQDILDAVGLTLETGSGARRRDPAFRERVLKAYEFRCAVCGFDVRLGNLSIALDAAHIRWHQAGGPDVEGNGLALCVLHHKTFDLGAFTASGGRRARVRPGARHCRVPGVAAGLPRPAGPRPAAARLAAGARAPRLARPRGVQGGGQAPGLITISAELPPVFHPPWSGDGRAGRGPGRGRAPGPS
jgi:putative restriction endonuclease